MEERTKLVLSAALREFIETGMPVSSEQLYRKYGFKVKPATIRNELGLLTEQGFLFQPHTSGGRMPTDKGYRFLVDVVFEDTAHEEEKKETRAFDALRDELISGAFTSFVNNLSESLDLLGIGYGLENKNVVKSGLRALVGDLVRNLEVQNLQEVEEVVSDFELIDERIQDLSRYLGKSRDPSVFIGKSPITKSRPLSVIADRIETEDDEFVIAVIGPKRMDYEGNIKFFVTLKNMLSHE